MYKYKAGNRSPVVLCPLAGMGKMQQIKHCVVFDALDVWFLENLKDFEKRSLAIGRCPKCKKQIAVLKETNKTTKKEYINTFSGSKALKIIKNEVNRVTYTALQLDNIDKSTVGFRFGVNKELRNKYNKITSVKQYSCDFFNNKHLTKKISF